jgi:hypothetical protein
MKHFASVAVCFIHFDCLFDPHNHGWLELEELVEDWTRNVDSSLCSMEENEVSQGGVFILQS